MQPDPGVAGQPGGDLAVGVRRGVVAHHMQLPPRPRAGDLLEKDQELILAVPRKAAAQHLAGGSLQRREQVGDP